MHIVKHQDLITRRKMNKTKLSKPEKLVISRTKEHIDILEIDVYHMSNLINKHQHETESYKLALRHLHKLPNLKKLTNNKYKNNNKDILPTNKKPKKEIIYINVEETNKKPYT